MNRPTTKFYNSDDVNAKTVELRHTKARLISLYETKVTSEMSKLDVFLWVSAKCIPKKVYSSVLRFFSDLV